MEKIEALCGFACGIGCKALRDEPMSKYTSFKIGGPAELFLVPDSVQQLTDVVQEAKKLDVPVTVLGNGSNLLVADEGIRGAVIHMDEGFQELRLVSETEIACSAGVPLKRLCLFALENNLTGLEFAYGIPGSAGGAAFMNAGAYGGEMKDVLAACEHIAPDGTSGRLEGEALELSYRHSAYSGNGCIITTLFLKLQKGNPEEIAQKHKELMGKRKEKQPLEYPSAGSVFKRPEGYFAGTLIEQCGLKGKTIGGAQVSEKHAGFIINIGGATCADVLALVAFIQEEVFRTVGVHLEPEIRRIGG